MPCTSRSSSRRWASSVSSSGTLAAENAATRRAAGLGAIIASLLTCGLALYPLSKTIRLGLDLQGGTEFLLQVQGNPTPQALDQAISVIRKRLDTLGTREISIQPEGRDRLQPDPRPAGRGGRADREGAFPGRQARVPPRARERPRDPRAVPGAHGRRRAHAALPVRAR
ncbi:MAG: hypothetical protein WDO13_08610 [Verrucomicrobiota bacterium]